MKRMLMVAMALFVSFFACAASDPALYIGDQTFYASNGSKDYSQYGARVSYTGSGFRIAFYSDAIVYSDREAAIESSKDVTVVLGTGVTVLVNGFNAGILSTGGDVVVMGGGTLNVRTREVWLLRNNVGIGAHGDVLITLGATVNVGAHDTLYFLGANCIQASGKIKIEAAMANLCCERSLLVGYGGVVITASIVNLMQGAKDSDSSTAVYSNGGDICIVGSVVSLVGKGVGIASAGSLTIGQSCVGIVSRGISLSGGAGDVKFADSRIMAVSSLDSAVSLSGSGASYPDPRLYEDEDGNRFPETVFVGDGEYRFGTITNRTCIMGGVNIEIDGGHVECCSPWGVGAYARDFVLKDGSLKMVDKMDFRECYQNIMAEAVVLSTVGSSGVFENSYGLKSTLFTSMVEQFLLTELTNPKGSADYAVIADTYRQYGGEVVQGSSKYGYLATKDGTIKNEIGTISIPALNGGICHALLGARGWYKGTYYDYYELHPTNRYGTTFSRTSKYPYWTSSNTRCVYGFMHGDSGVGNQGWTTVKTATAKTLPGAMFTREGYIQTGWSSTENGSLEYDFGESVTVAGNMFFYPVWSSLQYDIRYASDGANGSMAGQSCVSGRVYKLSQNKFTNSGDRFIGWRSSANDKLYDDGLLVFNLASGGESVTMTAEWESKANRYMVIDLSGGTNATHYPVSYRGTVPYGGWTEEYKTTKLVLRRIEPGEFRMGLHTGDCPDISSYYGEDRGWKSVSQPYYIGVFEVTQRQWELVMGTRPSSFTNIYYYATRPVESVYDDQILESTDSFMERLRTKTNGAGFDLPTEVQWEYACRAGTTTGLNDGSNVKNDQVDANLNALGRYAGNNGSALPQMCGYYKWFDFNSWRGNNENGNSGTAPVGTYLSNSWGLYDMHGNVEEVCADLSEAKGGTSAGSGSASGSSSDYKTNIYHITKGGSWWQTAIYACSGSWQCWQQKRAIWRGFRLVYNIENP